MLKRLEKSWEYKLVAKSSINRLSRGYIRDIKAIPSYGPHDLMSRFQILTEFSDRLLGSRRRLRRVRAPRESFARMHRHTCTFPLVLPTVALSGD